MDQHSLAFSRPHLVLLAVLAAIAAIALGALSSAPAAQAASCAQVDLPGNGYITSLHVKRVSCATGKTVARAYASCRLKKGKAGRCTSKVRGYSCKETGRTRIPTEINAKVTCKRGVKSVIHTYQQNL